MAPNVFSVEQHHGYFWAVSNKDFEPAHELLTTHECYEIKNKSRHLPKDNPEWNRIQYPTSKRLFFRKMEQNPDLLNTTGSQPFESDAYDHGTFKGLNEFGEMATTWRHKQITKFKSELINCMSYSSVGALRVYT